MKGVVPALDIGVEDPVHDRPVVDRVAVRILGIGVGRAPFERGLAIAGGQQIVGADVRRGAGGGGQVAQQLPAIVGVGVVRLVIAEPVPHRVIASGGPARIDRHRHLSAASSLLPRPAAGPILACGAAGGSALAATLPGARILSTITRPAGGRRSSIIPNEIAAQAYGAGELLLPTGRRIVDKSSGEHRSRRICRKKAGRVAAGTKARLEGGHMKLRNMALAAAARSRVAAPARRAGFHRGAATGRDADHPGAARRRTPTGSTSGLPAAAPNPNGNQQLSADTLWFINPEGSGDERLAERARRRRRRSTTTTSPR